MNKTMNSDIERIMLTEEEIAAEVKKAAAWLDERYRDCAEPPIAISVLKGSVVFSAIFCARWTRPCRWIS